MLVGRLLATIEERSVVTSAIPGWLVLLFLE